MRLNGWQRLFVVGAVLALPGAAIMANSMAPTRSQINASWADALLDAAADAEDKSSESIRGRYFASASDSTVIARMPAFASDPFVTTPQFVKAVTNINARYEQITSELRGDVRRFWFLAATWYAAFFGALYALGWSLGWVYRGFRRRE